MIIQLTVKVNTSGWNALWPIAHTRVLCFANSGVSCNAHIRVRCFAHAQVHWSAHTVAESDCITTGNSASNSIYTRVYMRLYAPVNVTKKGINIHAYCICLL